MSEREPVNIVILGASFAGLTVAHQFLRKTIHGLGVTRTAPRYRVVLIGPNTHLYWNIGAPRLICSSKLVRETEAFLPFLPEFQVYPQGQFQFLQGIATGVDFTQRKVSVEMIEERPGRDNDITSKWRRPGSEKKSSKITGWLVPYHALVIATGTSANSPLLSLHGSHDKTVAAIDSFHTGLVNASTVVIVGGGPSGVECAGQLATWIERAHVRKEKMVSVRERLKRLNPRRKAKVPGRPEPEKEPLRITLISGHDRLLPKLPGKVGQKAEKMLKALGVRILHGVRLVSAQELPSRVTRCVLNGELTIYCDLFIAATGLEPNTGFLPAEMLDASGYVVVDQRYMRLDRGGDRVYAVGDCCSFAKNTILDIYDSIPVLMHNMRNDLWEFEIKIQNPYGGGEEKLERLNDLEFKQDNHMTQMCPITRWGGVGVLFDRKLISFVVYLLKGRNYNFPKASKVVTHGEKLFPTKETELRPRF